MPLSSEEQLALEEYKLVFEAYHRSEDIFTRWENLFLLAETIMLSGSLQLIIQRQIAVIQFIPILLGIGGTALSLLWFFIISRSYLFSQKRIERLKEIEKYLQKTITSNEEKISIFSYINYISETTDPRHQKIPFHQRLSSWKCRKALPLIFTYIWAVFIAASLYIMI